MSQQSGGPAGGEPDGPGRYGPYGGAPTPPPPGDPGQYGAPPPPGEYGQHGGPAPLPPSQYGQYGGPAPPPPSQYGQYGQAPSGGYYGAGFVPVPTAVQPGIIPLRPLTLGEIYDGAFRAIRHNPMVMFGLAIIVIGGGSVLQIAFTAVMAGQIERALQAGLDDVGAYFGVIPIAGLLLSSVALGLATLVLEGLAIISVSESVIGRKVSLGEVWQRARGRIWRLIALSVLLTVASFVAIGLGIGVIVLIVLATVQVSSDAWVGLLILVPLLFLAIAVLIGFFAVRLMMATCVVMLEGTGVFASIARSWRLTRGHFWRLLGIMLLTIVLVMILVSILSVPFQMFGTFFASSGDILLPLIVTSVGQLVGSALSVPVMAAVLALLYIDVRMRKEGLDVELARAAQGP